MGCAVMARAEARFVLCSQRAFYAIHWQAYTNILERYAVRGTVLTSAPPPAPPGHDQLGDADPRALQSQYDIRFFPAGGRRERRRWLRAQLAELQPDAIWVQEEPVNPDLLDILRILRFNRHTRIATAVCENIFPATIFLRRWRNTLLWSRLNALLSVASPSARAIQQAGLPRSVPVINLAAGALVPPDNVMPLPLPFERTEHTFVIGFVGRIVEEKGWKFLLRALEQLPANFRLVMVGDGDQREELHQWLQRDSLRGRAFALGLFPKHELWRVYRAIDCLVLPSITVPFWTEQFGGVLADAMAMRLPVIGSRTGGIPEVIGDAGLIVPEGDADALAAALRRLQSDPALCQQFGERGEKRFHAEFAIPAYARKIATALSLPLRDA